MNARVLQQKGITTKFDVLQDSDHTNTFKVKSVLFTLYPMSASWFNRLKSGANYMYHLL
jgi:hypothetical protein